jgi:hypothetical protein
MDAISDLLDEVGAKNNVRVTKFEACKCHGRIKLTEVMDQIAKLGAHPPALIVQDHVRMLAGKKPIYLGEMLRRFGGDLRSVTPNGRTTVGIDFCYNVLGSAAQPAVADYIALSNNTAATAVGDTNSTTAAWSSNQTADAAASTTTGEMTYGGMTRAHATPAHTGGATNYTMTYTWTATGTVTAASKAGLFGGSSKTAQSTGANNILFVTNTFTATTLATNDQLSLVWTVNI